VDAKLVRSHLKVEIAEIELAHRAAKDPALYIQFDAVNVLLTRSFEVRDTWRRTCGGGCRVAPFAAPWRPRTSVRSITWRDSDPVFGSSSMCSVCVSALNLQHGATPTIWFNSPSSTRPRITATRATGVRGTWNPACSTSPHRSSRPGGA
jgi:hypothetical protein